MPEDERRSRAGNVVKVSVIVSLLTIAAVLAHVRARPDRSIDDAAHSVHRGTRDHGIRGGGGRLPAETAAATDGPWNATEDRDRRNVTVSAGAGHQDRIRTTVPDGARVVPRTRFGAEQSAGVARYSNGSATEAAAASGREAPLPVVRDELMGITRAAAGRKATFVGDHVYVERVVSPDTAAGAPRTKIRPNQKGISYYGDLSMQQTDTGTAENDTSTGYYNAYDITFNGVSKESKLMETPKDGTGWSPIFRPEQELARAPSPAGTSGLTESLKPSPVGLEARYSADQDDEFRVQSYASNDVMKPWENFMTFMSPSYWMGSSDSQLTLGNRPASPTLQPPSMNTRQLPANSTPVQNAMPGFQQQMLASIPTISEISWRRIGAMAVIKLGLVKLKAIGFINVLLFLLFKIKTFMALVFFKFLSLLKFLKLFKFLIVPLLVIPFLPILASFIYPMNRMNPQAFPTPSNNLVNFNIRPDGSSEESGETVLIPGETILIPESTTTVTRPQIVPTNDVLPDSIADALNFLSGGRYEPNALLDPNLDLFRNELDSEKCVERIACKMAATGKAGIMPLWINWMLHGMTKSIPNDKFVYYLKAYDEVTNEIHTKSPNPDNWEQWCFERYECDNTNESDETDTR